MITERESQYVAIYWGFMSVNSICFHHQDVRCVHARVCMFTGQEEGSVST